MERGYLVFSEVTNREPQSSGGKNHEKNHNF